MRQLQTLEAGLSDLCESCKKATRFACGAGIRLLIRSGLERADVILDNSKNERKTHIRHRNCMGINRDGGHLFADLGIHNQ